MTKVTDIDLSDDRLISIAAEMVDNHNYIGALKMLNKNAEISGNDRDSLMLYAEIFDDMGLYEKCVNGWFKYMDNADMEDLSDCYEGLAMAYMNLGNEHFSAYYYNKLLMENGEIDSISRGEILSDFMSMEENPLKIVYPPALADYSEIFLKAIGKMKGGDFDGAIEEFDKIAEGNEKYFAARNYVAMCRIIEDRTEEAEQECLKILKSRPNDVQALTTLAAVKTEEGKSEEAVALANRLLKLKVTEPDDIYKIATVCCENKMHEEAYKTFCLLTEEYEYDLNLLYFKGVSAFNCGRYDDSFKAFDTLVTLYPDAVTGRYFYNAARKFKDSDEKVEFSYFYRLPMELRESSLKMLAAFVKLSDSGAKKLAAEVDFGDCIKWCFDEVEGKCEELQQLAAHAAVKGGLDEIVRDILLNAFLDDRIKIEVLSRLAERNEYDCFGVVICNVFRRVSTQQLELGRVKKKAFIKAYSRLFAHFAILDDDFGISFSAATEELYNKLEAEDRLSEVKGENVLTAAIYELSKVEAAEVTGDKIYEFFDVKKEKVKALLS